MRDDSKAQGVSRRTLLKTALLAGAASLVGLGGFATVRTLTYVPRKTVRETFLYLRMPGDLTPWWEERGLVGQPARWHDFGLDQGANVLWRTVEDADGKVLPGSGFPALLLRVGDDRPKFPEGYPRERFMVSGLYAVFNVCPHAGCRANWKVTPLSDMETHLPYPPICCPCHYAEFDPYAIEEYHHPRPPEGNGARYPGVRVVQGPAHRGMPLIPLEVVDGLVVGRMRDPEWYAYLDYQ